MNILFTTNRFYPDIGGIESVSLILSHYFVHSGNSIRVITQTSGNSQKDTEIFPFMVIRRPSAVDLLSSYHWADVVFQNNIEVRQLWPLLFFRRPLVIALHTWLRNVNQRRTLLDFAKKIALLSATYVVACSDSIRSDSFERSIVIGNPYESDVFRILPEIKKKNSIVFLGRLVSDKGVSLLIRAFAYLNDPDWTLSIIGSGPEHMALRKLAENLCLGDSITFCGSLQGDALVRELNTHKIMVIPSQWPEPFGVVALEGLACGCVVLASDGGGLPDAVGSAGLLFKRGDLVDLIYKLSGLMNDPSKIIQYRSESAAHLSRYEPAFVCSQYLRLLENAFIIS